MNPDKITDVVFLVLCVGLGVWHLTSAVLGRQMEGSAGYYFAALLMAGGALQCYRRLTDGRE